MRLTIKDKEIRDNFNAEYAKLADLEDIEEELGIDLVTLFKALKNGIWIKIDNKIEDFDVYGINKNRTDNKVCFSYRYDGVCLDTIFELKDYGKTWALTKEELL